MNRTTSALLTIHLLLLGSACGDDGDPAPTDGGSEVDGGGDPDAATEPDGGGDPDAGLPNDAGTDAMEVVGSPPDASEDRAIVGAGASIEVPVLANDTDRDGDVLTMESVSTPSSGGTAVAGDATVTYTAPADFLGDDTFEYTVRDGAGNTASARVTIQVVADLSEGLGVDAATISLYKLEEETAGTSTDATEHGNDGTDDGTTVVDGPWGRARQLDGVSDRIDMDAVREALQGSTSFTLEILARSGDGETAPGLVNHSCSNGWYLLPVRNQLATNLKTTAASGGYCSWYGGFQQVAVPHIGQRWHHSVLIWDGAQMHTYQDGVSYDSRSVTGMFSGTASGAGAWIGYNSYSGTYSGGYIDEIRVTANAMTAEQIEATWLGLTWHWPRLAAAVPAVGAAGVEVSLVGWRLDEVSTVLIGASEATTGAQTATEIAVAVPGDLEAGLHDVTVVTEDGRWSVFEGGFEIVP